LLSAEEEREVVKTNSTCDGRVIAASQLSTKQLNAVRRKHEHQQNQQDRHLQHVHGISEQHVASHAQSNRC